MERIQFINWIVSEAVFLVLLEKQENEKNETPWRDYATTVTTSKEKQRGGGGDSIKSLHPKIFHKKKKE